MAIRLWRRSFLLLQLDDSSVKRSIDSGRGFVLRVVDRISRRSALLGIMFEDRGEAFDFSAALLDNKRRENAELKEKSNALEGTEYGLASGTTLTVKVPTKSTKNIDQNQEEDVDDWTDFTAA